MADAESATKSLRRREHPPLIFCTRRSVRASAVNMTERRRETYLV
jgi:hypothetical protein